MEQEELREILIDLDRARERERRLRLESEGLLEGLDIITHSASAHEAFVHLLQVIQNLIHFDDAFVLVDQNDGILTVVASTHPVFENTKWRADTLLRRVLTGRPAILFDITSSREWQEQPDSVRANVNSALHAPLATLNKQAILVCTSSEHAHFEKKQVKLLQRFSPLASQALHNLQINEQLRSAIAQAKTMALKANAASRSKSEFLANMSHEIRTPLNGIIGNLDLAMSGELTPDLKDFLDSARISAEHLLGVINDVLDFSKVEAGCLELESVPFSPQACLRQVVDTLSLKAREKGLELACSIESGIPHLFLGDPIRLRQVLINLIGNAIKFTAAGKVATRCESIGKLGDTVELRFSIHDTGVGIPPEKLNLIFDRFEQADGSVTRRFGGTGLGLTISRHLVKLMGGRIWVASEAGTGSTFFFTVVLPIAKETEHEEALDTASSPAESLPDRLPRLRILLAEDNPINQKLACRMIEKLGHQVSMASDGEQALILLEAEDFDLVLMDIQMPNLDGLRATAAIRGWEGPKRSIPIIAMTAHAMKGDRERCLDGGMDDYITKPIVMKNLDDLLRRWNGKGRSTS